MFNVRLAGGHLYGKQLFTWLSLVVSLIASFALSFFPLDVLDEIWDLNESVSEGFLTYSPYRCALVSFKLCSLQSSIISDNFTSFYLFLYLFIYLFLKLKTAIW